MARSGSWVTRVGVWGMASLVLVLSACSAIHHDCAERRDCPAPDPIDIGSGDDWWNGGGSSPTEGDGGSGTAAGAGGEGGLQQPEAGAAGAGEHASPLGIVQVSPSDGARGVRSDARIVIDFSRPMDMLACEAAYESSDLPAASLAFEWDETSTRLTLTPRAQLSYAIGAADGELAFAARSYHFGFASGARARDGEPLAAVSFGFSTLRQVAFTLPADPERSGNWTDGEGEGIHNCLRHPKSPYEPTVCVGDDPSNVRYDGFLSFDLSPLPPQIALISSARLVASASLHGAPDALGPSRIEHVAFGELDADARSAPAFATLGPLFAGSFAGKSDLDLSVDLTAAIADDYTHRAARNQRAQYRLGFAQVVPNAHWDDIELPTSGIRLALSFLLP